MDKWMARKLATIGALFITALTPALAQIHEFNIPPGNLQKVLEVYIQQSGIQIVYKVDNLSHIQSPGVRNATSADDALTALLAGTGFKSIRDASGAVAVVHNPM